MNDRVPDRRGLMVRQARANSLHLNAQHPPSGGCCGLWKLDFRNASILKDGRAVFNIAGNKYRLVVWINYAYRVVYIRFIGTHAQYDKIDVQTV
ncbi:type II toxin-antitoxin system HigB family toxin [Halomonas sp. RT37]|uniref:type II toxin-antitoxin system HigB family toxin n=1 Tax=unclassified Halomonas TaxID=2609666 RepID=UPI0032B5429E